MCAVDSIPVGDQHFIAYEHERRAGVDDSLPVGDGSGDAPDFRGGGGNFPEASRTVDGDGGQVADEGRGVDVAEFIGPEPP